MAKKSVFTLLWTILFALSAFTGPVSFAEDKFPSEPITLIVGFAPGGTGDLPLRYLGETASKKLGQPVIVINKPGAGGAVALGEVKNAKPDGYTIAFLSTGGVMGAHMRKLPYDPVKDFEPVIQHTASVYGLVVQADSPFKTLEDLIAYAKKNPNKVTYSTAGASTPQHIVMLQLADAAGVKWTHIPMGGGVKAATQLLGGHVTACAGSPEWKPFVDEGRLRLIAMFGDERLEDYPDVPTLKELGYDIVAPSLYSVVGPKGIPEDRVLILHDALHEGMKTQGYKDLLKKFNLVVIHRDPKELGAYIQDLYDTSGKAISKIKKQK